MHDHSDIPAELRPIARLLEEDGAAERREGTTLSARLARDTAGGLHVARLRPRPLAGTHGGWGRALSWGLPLATAAALAFAVLWPTLIRPQSSSTRADVLAADLEDEFDALSELDALWSEDAYHLEMALLRIEAAGAASEETTLESVAEMIDADL